MDRTNEMSVRLYICLTGCLIECRCQVSSVKNVLMHIALIYRKKCTRSLSSQHGNEISLIINPCIEWLLIGNFVRSISSVRFAYHITTIGCSIARASSMNVLLLSGLIGTRTIPMTHRETLGYVSC